MPKVTFEFNAKKEYEYIKFFEEHFGEVLLPRQLRKNFANKAETIKALEQSYDPKKKEAYEREWRKIEEDYFDMVESITGHQWRQKAYRVVMTKYMYGFCDPLDVNVREVTCRQDYKAIERNYIIAHELLHSHYFDIIATKSDPRLASTELNENFNVLLLCFSDIRQLLVKPDDEWIIDGWIQSNQQAAPYFGQLLPLWNNRKDLDDYLAKSAAILKQ